MVWISPDACFDLCEVHAGPFLQHLTVPQKTDSACPLIFPHPLLRPLLVRNDSKLSEGVFHPIALVADKNIKAHWTQNLSLGNGTRFQLPLGLSTSDDSRKCLAVQVF